MITCAWPAAAVEIAPRNHGYADPLGVLGHPPDPVDFIQFDGGLVLSKECENRCNNPASAHFAREVDGSADFTIEAFYPTNNTTMVWRGSIRGDTVTGTVEGTAHWFYRTVTQPLEPNGIRSSVPVGIGL